MIALLIAIGWGGLGYVMGHMVRSFDNGLERQHGPLSPPPPALWGPFGWLFPYRKRARRGK